MQKCKAQPATMSTKSGIWTNLITQGWGRPCDLWPDWARKGFHHDIDVTNFPHPFCVVSIIATCELGTTRALLLALYPPNIFQAPHSAYEFIGHVNCFCPCMYTVGARGLPESWSHPEWLCIYVQWLWQDLESNCELNLDVHANVITSATKYIITTFTENRVNRYYYS